MRRCLLIFCVIVPMTVSLFGTEFHVSISGNDSNPGTKKAPLRTIQHTADLAHAGDIIIVHGGVYRERISPPRGGDSDSKRIVYQAARGEKVEITGSEPMTNWVKIQPNVWKATIPSSFFGWFNPYSDVIHGDWFNPKGREHHTGAVYLNGDWLTEATSLDDVLKPLGTNALWFGKVDPDTTTIWAQFDSVDPNQQRVEINVRQSVFYPETTGINYITVRGFTLENAATPWAPPTAEQIGLIGPHWSRGWIIESNIVRYSVCSGISLGKYGDQWDNTSRNQAQGYVETVERALTNGWSKDMVGHHIVRNNLIEHCEQAGIVGSLGAAFSTVTGNTIHDIYVRRLFTGAEMAGIKFHGAVDVTISRNQICGCGLGLWLDWMAQGTHVSRNLFHDNDQDVFVEVDHGPFMLDNNLLLSRASLLSRSQGGAYVHNLFGGTIQAPAYDGRQTPFLRAHSTQIAGFHDNPRGDDRYYNNLFTHADLSQYDDAKLPVWMDGNVFFDGAKPSQYESNPLLIANFDPALRVEQRPDGVVLEIQCDPAWTMERKQTLVTGALLGKAAISGAAYEEPDGTPIRVDTDYFGRKRDSRNPLPGPFEKPGKGQERIRVW